jgi:uncharacterized damage-inducible protein DinB
MMDMGTFLRYFANVRGRTERVFACIPPAQLEWRPRPGSFSFGDLVRHIAATERYMFAENAQGRPSRYPGHGPELAAGWDEVMAFLQQMHAESMAIFRSLPEAGMTTTCVTPGGARLAVWKWLRAMIEHEVHHRGQVYLMLGIIGVETPPLYGLTSEEVRGRSVDPAAGRASPGA